MTGTVNVAGAEPSKDPVLSAELDILADAFRLGGTEDCTLMARRLEVLSAIARCQENELAQWRKLKDVQTQQAGGEQ